MDKEIFYRCNVCGNLAGMIENSGVVPQCCNQPMEKLQAGSADASHEKHVPIVSRDNKKLYVSVGETPHPMSELHYIEWIFVQTNQGGYRKKLTPGCQPEARFRLCENEKVICVFAYCNLHGLWEACAETKHHED